MLLAWTTDRLLGNVRLRWRPAVDLRGAGRGAPLELLPPAREDAVADLFYYANNHDVWRAHVDADAHYASAGWREGRNPNAFFDTSYYLAANPDVAASGVNPLVHYDLYGWQEGRLPSLAFDQQSYLVVCEECFLSAGLCEVRRREAATEEQ